MTDANVPQRSGDRDIPAQDRYRAFPVDTPQGPLAVAEWVPQGDVAGEQGEGAQPLTVLAIHGVTSNHRAWPYLAAALPQARILAPDLRGRGCSAGVGEPYGMRSHAQDMARVLAACQVEQAIVVGHSMGGFVALVTAAESAERISQLILVEGGIPLTPPPQDPRESAGSNPEHASTQGRPSEADLDAIVDHVTAPIAARLQMQFSSMDEALAYWRNHPAFVSEWTPTVEDHARYDLTGAGRTGAEPPFRSRVSLAAMRADSKDLMASPDVPAALRHLRHPTHWITVERGLQNETPGLYSPELIQAWRGLLPHVRWHHADDLNHYTIVMSERGAGIVADVVRRAIS